MIKVVKFGGSSLASAEQFAKVGKIIHADKERRYVVPSAPGKRNSKDTKVTDMLSVAFDTTLVALALSIILMFGIHNLRKRQDSLFAHINAYLIENLINRFYK